MTSRKDKETRKDKTKISPKKDWIKEKEFKKRGESKSTILGKRKASFHTI